MNKDGFLDEKEYIAYFQPYDFPHMYEVEMERAMKDLDKDTDGFISMQEFIGGLFTFIFVILFLFQFVKVNFQCSKISP